MSGGGREADGRPAAVRADARRNRALVLQAARSAFEERGLGVPLGEIARRAGVGPGTVYRHFPSKEALFRAAVRDRLRLFADTAADVADAEDPGGVFFRFLASVVRLAAPDRALCEALSAAGEDVPAVAGAAPDGPDLEFRTALGILLVRAQQAGAVRKDVDLEDVRVLLAGCLAMERRRSAGRGPADPEAGPEAGPAAVPVGRMTALMLDGLRAGRNVTELPTAARKRNETRCRVCGTALRPARTGRPARYCGGACRQKAHRARGTAPPAP
ncbi:TetR/AcrR family transcriptional regulator [Streptomyces sp. RS10V-4]|uniref:TetR/AcrR family transcriptional regulator n=1 Tax=Streptomyces rhizoryzae TaxID=2932493 RepID=UPI0020052767|nr:TetR/AcrR family transcriptional regulator [Streptomyces rhizoryzae]MCK7623350.1 TetR/AcrR family transcriptional regulator [Streptomyces rhizoryzae]